VSAGSAESPIASLGEAERAIANLNTILDRLVETVAAETAHVRAGRLADAAKLEETKAELARHYAAESARVTAARNLIAGSAPAALAALRQRHEAFKALLQTNLTVLATAHAVSEGIIRGVSGELARKRAPSTYSASGRAEAAGAKTSQPLALCRTL
jgi:thiosulfate reductase cytochrome b subunit